MCSVALTNYFHEPLTECPKVQLCAIATMFLLPNCWVEISTVRYSILTLAYQLRISQYRQQKLFGLDGQVELGRQKKWKTEIDRHARVYEKCAQVGKIMVSTQNNK